MKKIIFFLWMLLALCVSAVEVVWDKKEFISAKEYEEALLIYWEKTDPEKAISYREEKVKKARELIEEKARKARERKEEKEGPVIEMVHIRSGSFMMGNDSGDADEKPVHLVRISNDFYIGKYEVTERQFQVYCRDTKSCYTSPPASDNPVTVSWDDAHAYAKWLSIKRGKRYRLPTEAEWEYVAKKGESAHSNMYQDQYAWFAKNSNYTQSVGIKRPNLLGIYDMQGNVWEWCEDWKASYNVTPRNGSANIKGKKISKIVRGGSYDTPIDRLRVTYRMNYRPHQGRAIGFRLIME